MKKTQSTSQSCIQPCDWSIDQLPGLDPQSQTLLQTAGICTTRQLLQTAHSPAGRQTLANQLQIHLQYVNKWVALADLAQVPSVGCQYCGLLLHAGISGITQLAQMHPQKLHQQILRLQVSTLQRRDLCPSVEQVSRWIQQARILTS
jgi:predicted flap endonuclease-1-like 5' DNA nuclease